MLGLSDTTIGALSSLVIHVGIAAACFGVWGNGRGEGSQVYFVSIESDRASDSTAETEISPEPPAHTAPERGAGVTEVSQRKEEPRVTPPARARVAPPRARLSTTQPPQDQRGEEGGGGLFGALFSPPQVINFPKPTYPQTARRRSIEGNVGLSLSISSSGALEGVTVKKTSGYAELDEAALLSAKEGSYRPAQRAGIPVSSRKDVMVTFSLVE